MFRTEKIAYHRNGVSGAGFSIVLFKDDVDEDSKGHRFVGIVFDEPGCVAVLDVDMLADGDLEFARGNSWRGSDYWGDKLRAAIARKWRKDRKKRQAEYDAGKKAIEEASTKGEDDE